MKETGLIIGMSGASGAPLTLELLRQLKKNGSGFRTHLICTEGAKRTLQEETEASFEELAELADVVCDNADIGAGCASGTFLSAGMMIVPCSMKTAAGIVTGYSDNLLLRAADVTLKERRKLVLVAREAPLGTIHLRNLYELSRMGAVIIPPVVSYYQNPKTLDDINRHIIGKVLDQFQIEGEGYSRWNPGD